MALRRGNPEGRSGPASWRIAPLPARAPWSQAYETGVTSALPRGRCSETSGRNSGAVVQRLLSNRPLSKPDHARRIRDLIRSRVLESEFPVGSRLPDEPQLMDEYHVGRNVVRAALAQLQHEGLISRIQGAGTFAVVHKTRHMLTEAHGLTWSVVSAAGRLSTRVLSAHTVPTPFGVAMHLGTAPDSLCLAVDVVTEIDGEASMVLTSYVPEPVHDRIAEHLRAGRWAGDWYDALGAAGLKPVRRDVIAEAVVADEFVAPILAIEVGAPMMRFERRLVIGEGDDASFEYGFSYCRGDRLAFAFSDCNFSGKRMV
jgi:GntR family transcriptional regulator